MDPRSEQIIGQILNPSPLASGAAPESASTPITFEQILNPSAPASAGYAGPERRAQGYLIAETVEKPAAVDPLGPSDRRL